MTKRELLKFVQDMGYGGRFIVYLIEDFLHQTGMRLIYHKRKYYVVPGESYG
jgi:hypothetical protein